MLKTGYTIRKRGVSWQVILSRKMGGYAGQTHLNSSQNAQIRQINEQSPLASHRTLMIVILILI